MTDYFSSPSVAASAAPTFPYRSFGSPFDVNTTNILSSSHGKRRRYFEEENETENSFQHSNEDNCSPYPAEKRARSRAFISPQFNHDERLHELEKGIQKFEEEIQYLKEHIETKDEQIAIISNENQELHQQCESFAENNIKLNEENRILKKAVGIQENRLRELQNQQQNMQEIMNQAADYIANLERINASLRHRIECNDSTRSSFLPDIPPDVY